MQGTFLLVMDAGNTDVTVGVFLDDQCVARARVSHQGGGDTAAALVDALPGGVAWCGAVVASVAPSLDDTLKAVCREVTGRDAVWIDHQADLGVTVVTDRPEQVGADRLVNAAGAYLAYGGPLVVADVGTAITLCAVNAEGHYLGGAIAPGPAIGRDALAQRTEKLPEVDLVIPKSPIGTTTETAMQAGLVLGFAGLLDRLIADTVAALGGRGVGVYLTGGLAPLLAPHLRQHHRKLPDLTLESLHRLYHRIAG